MVPRRRIRRVRQKLASGSNSPSPSSATRCGRRRVLGSRRRCRPTHATAWRGGHGRALLPSTTMFGLVALGLEKALFTVATKMGEIDGAGFRIAKWYQRYHDRHGAEWREELRKEISAQRRFVWDTCSAVELDTNVSFRTLKFGL